MEGGCRFAFLAAAFPSAFSFAICASATEVDAALEPVRLVCREPVGGLIRTFYV